MEKNELVQEISYLNSKIYMLNNTTEQQQKEIERLEHDLGCMIGYQEDNFRLEKEINHYEQALKEIINIKNTYSDGDDTFMHVDDPYLYEAIEIAQKALNESN